MHALGTIFYVHIDPHKSGLLTRDYYDSVDIDYLLLVEDA